MDELAARGRPFLFAVGFELDRAFVFPLEEIDPVELRYDFRGRANFPSARRGKPPALRILAPPGFDRYRGAFARVRAAEDGGESFLTNLTFPSEVGISAPLGECLPHLDAPYRLWARGSFLLFSPEAFVRVEGETISTCPMKGTIPASVPDAARRLLADEKEAAEHATVVDLLRNDLSMVARDVGVARYRYVEAAGRGAGALYQTSSEVRGRLAPFYLARPGSLLARLLPAGSVSGAPKRSTCGIIAAAEGGPRGWYCGVAGIWEGGRLDSAVMIRFVEERAGRFFFRSGGGITVYSDARAEYEELLAKVRLPLRGLRGAVKRPH